MAKKPILFIKWQINYQTSYKKNTKNYNKKCNRNWQKMQIFSKNGMSHYRFLTLFVGKCGRLAYRGRAGDESFCPKIFRTFR
jgi:hypothetical protein